MPLSPLCTTLGPHRAFTSSDIPCAFLPQASALAGPSAWDVLAPDPRLVGSFAFFRFQLKCQPSDISLTALSKLGPSPWAFCTSQLQRSCLPGSFLYLQGPALPGTQWVLSKRMLMNSCTQGDALTQTPSNRGPENSQQGSVGLQGGGHHPLEPHYSKQGPCTSSTDTARELVTKAESQAWLCLLKCRFWF